MSRKSLRDNAYADVLSHGSLGCRDVKLIAKSAMSCSILNSKKMVVDISKDVPKAPTNEVCGGHEYIDEWLVVKEKSLFQ